MKNKIENALPRGLEQRLYQSVLNCQSMLLHGGCKKEICICIHKKSTAFLALIVTQVTLSQQHLSVDFLCRVTHKSKINAERMDRNTFMPLCNVWL